MSSPIPEHPDDVAALVDALRKEAADARAESAHWARLVAAVVRASGPVLVHPGDYADVDPSTLGNVDIVVPGYPEPAQMFFLAEHANAIVGGMMQVLAAGLPEDVTLPHPDTFPGQAPPSAPPSAGQTD